MNYDIGTIVLEDDTETDDPYRAGRTAGLIYLGVYDALPDTIDSQKRHDIALAIAIAMIREFSA